MIVRVPASSANLGPGFDCFGIAWKLYNDIEFIPGGDGLKITGCPEKYCNEDNLCYRAYRATLDYCNLKAEPLQINFLKNEIPISRGLGSSAALIVGGVIAANEIHKLHLKKEELLSIATKIEGHPDNIAPALFGGFTASALADGKALSVSYPLSKNLKFTAVIPDFELSTELSRSVLPNMVSKADAVFNISRSALLIKALEEGDTSLISTALQDKIHQSYRFKLISGFEEVKTAALSCGAAGICISGAGSTLLCISDFDGFTQKLRENLVKLFPSWKFISVECDFSGAVISE